MLRLTVWSRWVQGSHGALVINVLGLCGGLDFVADACSPMGPSMWDVPLNALRRINGIRHNGTTGRHINSYTRWNSDLVPLSP